MAIPPFTTSGWLPEGIHDCTLEEAAQQFGTFQRSDQRPQLWAKFLEFMHEAKASGLVSVLLLDGSFVSAEPTPNDIDLILVMPADHEFSIDFRPSEYNVISKRRVHQRFGFDLLVARADSEEYDRYVRFFQQVRLDPLRKKGILRIQL